MSKWLKASFGGLAESVSAFTKDAIAEGMAEMEGSFHTHLLKLNNNCIFVFVFTM